MNETQGAQRVEVTSTLAKRTKVGAIFFKLGEGFDLPAGQTTLPLDLSRSSMLIFSKSRPPNATLAKAAFAPEIKGTPTQAETPTRALEDYVEEVLEAFPYRLVPLPVEWKP